jgi:hypothetical protein
MIVDGIDSDGTFLDLGCANGPLMESVVEWAAERGHRIEPYGVDLAPGLAQLAPSSPVLDDLGFVVGGSSSAKDNSMDATAWIDVDPGRT